MGYKVFVVVAVMALACGRAAADPAADAYAKGLADSKAGRYDDAVKDFDLAIHLNPAFAPAYDARGQAYEGLKQPQRAFSDYDQALALDPDLKEAAAHRAQVNRTMGNAAGAQSDLDALVARNPDDADAHMQRGIFYRQAKKNDLAIADFNEVIRLAPDYAGGFINRGVVYDLLNDQEKAAHDFKEAVRLNPKMAVAYYDLGIAYSKLNRTAEAIDNYALAILIKPDYINALNNRGEAWARLQRNREALADFNKVLAIAPGNAVALTGRGNIYNHTQQAELAVDDFSHARDAFDRDLRADPGNQELARSRAWNGFAGHRYKDAIADFSSYIAMNQTQPIAAPLLADAYLQRGWAKGETGDPAGGLADVETALRLKPDIDSRTWRHAWLLRAVGRYDAALKEYDGLVDPNVPRAYFERAITYFCLGRYAQALADMQTYIRISEHEATSDDWLDVFRSRHGAADHGLADKKPPALQTDWQTQIDSLYRGRQSLEATETAMKNGRSGPGGDDSWPCPVKFYLGEYKLVHGDHAGARIDLASIAPANCNWAEAAAAAAETKRLAANGSQKKTGDGKAPLQPVSRKSASK